MIFSISENKCLCNIGKSITTKEFILEWEALENSGEEETAIVEIAEDTFENEAIYNLQGIKVLKPVKGNIYIKGGKKFYVK